MKKINKKIPARDSLFDATRLFDDVYRRLATTAVSDREKKINLLGKHNAAQPHMLRQALPELG